MRRIIRKTNLIFAAFIALLIIFLLIVLLKKAPSEQYVLLSFGVEPVDGREDVAKVWNIIQEEGINATFFITGQYAEEFPEIVSAMQGQEIACQGYSHKKFTEMNTSEKKSEIKKCKIALQQNNGQKITGFRAPYNRIDTETLKILEEEGFVYDASIIKGLSLIYPNVDNLKIGEIPVSSFLGIPLEDVIWLYYLKIPGIYFYILETKESGMESYLFHPHIIAKEEARFREFINSLKKRNAIFISHHQLVETEHEGV